MSTSSAQPVARAATTAETIPDLVADAREGKLRIPPFQRRFRWGRTDIEHLFDSIWSGYPIGTLLLWQREAPAARVEFGPVLIEAAAKSDALFVVDGQQRLTSLVGVLAASPDVHGDFELYFDIAQQQFRYKGSRTPPSTWLPMRLVLDTNALLTWLLEFRDHGGTSEQVDIATTLGERLREFHVPVSTVSNADEDTLRIIFDRMNNFGRRLTKAEVFQALHAASGDQEPHDLRDVGEVAAALGFGSLRDDTLLRAVLAVRGGDVFRDFHREFQDGEDPADTYEKAAEALRRAVDFLQGEAGIPHVRALPYAFLIPVLVRFFHLHPDPGPRTLVLLRRWVWRASSVGAGSGSPSTQLLREMVQAVDSFEDLSAQRLLSALAPVPTHPLDMTAIQLNRAAARVNVALLSTLGPLDLRTGEPIDVPRLLGSDAPGGLLRLPTVGGSGTSLANLLLHPSLDDDELFEVLAGASSEARSSHAIPRAYTVEELEVSTRDFLRDRLETLNELLPSALAVLAEPGASDRPPIASLIVADAD